MRSTVTIKIRSKKSIPVIIIRFLTFLKVFGGFLKMYKKNVKKRITIIQMNFLFQIFMVIVDRIKNRDFFFSQKLKKIKSRLKNGGSHAPVFNFKRSTPRK
jgi:hypothetical protein